MRRSGFALIQVLGFSALLSVASLGILRWLNVGMRSEQTVRSAQNLQGFMTKMELLLLNPKQCEPIAQAIRTPLGHLNDARPEELGEGFVLSDDYTQIRVAPGAPATADWKIVSVVARDFEDRTLESQKGVKLVLELQKTVAPGQGGFGPSRIEREFPLLLQATGAKFTGCVLETDSSWSLACSPGEFMRGFNADMTPICAKGSASLVAVMADCKDGKIMRGIEGESTPACGEEKKVIPPRVISCSISRESPGPCVLDCGWDKMLEYAGGSLLFSYRSAHQAECRASSQDFNASGACYAYCLSKG